MNQQDGSPTGVIGGGRPAEAFSQGGETDALLKSVEQDLDLLNLRGAREQVPLFDRMHTALADALARTADTGGPPGSGDPGA